MSNSYLLSINFKKMRKSIYPETREQRLFSGGVYLETELWLISQSNYIKNMLAKGLLNRFISPLKPSDCSAMALSLMEEHKVWHWPVVKEEKYLGLITETDVAATKSDQSLESCKPSFSRPYVFDYQHFYDVVRIAAEQKLSLVPVLDAKESYLGCITTESIMLEMATVSSVVQPGGIIVLEMNEHDFSLAEIARIVEGNDAKILSSYITTFYDCKRIQVTIKVNRIDISPIIQTFNRYNYLIVAFFSDESKLDDLLTRRYDSLMNYLNV